MLRMEKEEGQDVEKASSSSRDGAFIFVFVRDPRIVDFRVPGFLVFFLWAGPPSYSGSNRAMFTGHKFDSP